MGGNAVNICVCAVVSRRELYEIHAKTRKRLAEIFVQKAFLIFEI
jgi:hypothetical protein